MQKRLSCILAVLFASAGLLLAQATAEINGRVVDQGQAVAPGANVTVTNAGSGAVRQTVTNAEGLYSVAALTPGNYNIKAELKGFAPVERNVELQIGAVLSVDFQMQVGAVQQSVSVEAQAELIESTQGTIAGSIRTQEVQELPMSNRSMGQLMSMMPGAREVPATSVAGGHGSSGVMVSFGGSAGGNYNMQVDGLDNKEDHCGGAATVYSLEGIQEFKLLNTGSAAEYGKGTATVLIATKSGTNQLHGTLFFFGRNQDLVRTDYFSDPAHGGLGKPPFSRMQYGGSVGGAIIKDKLWYFGSVERVQQNFATPRPGTLLTQFGYLANLNTGTYPPLDLLVGGSLPQPSTDLLVLAKINYQMTTNNSFYFRGSSERGYTNNSYYSTKAALLSYAPDHSDQNNQYLPDIAMGETWVISNRTVNQFTAQWIEFQHNTLFAQCPFSVPGLGTGPGNDSCIGDKLNFPSVSTGQANGIPDYSNNERKWEWRDDLSIQLGRHAVKFGADAWWAPTFGGIQTVGGPGAITFFADPQTIVTNSNGLYPQGFQTPGIVQSITEGSLGGGNYWSHDNYGVGGYVQDDFKVSRKVTLNLGLRYDIYNLFGSQAELASDRAYQVLKAIGSPYAGIPQLPKNDWQPRVGIAYDPKGNGSDVIRASFGMFSAQQLKNTTYYEAVQEQPYLFYLSKLTNTAVGVGQLAKYVYGVTPLPAAPVPALNNTFLVNANATAYWYDPKQFKNVQTFQYHAGWAHKLSGSSVISADHTFILGTNGWRWLDINPLINGVRPLAAAMEAVYGGTSPIIGNMFIDESVNRSHYDETQVHYEKRFSSQASFQVNYVLAWASGMGGVSDGTFRATSPYPQQASATGGNIYAPWEWGPTGFDERHRVTAVGVFMLPFKLEISPSLTFATARPYTLYKAINPSGEGGGLQVLNSSGNPIGIDSQRGQALFILNARVTRNFKFGERMKLAAFAELYNITDRANFGNQFGGNAYAPTTYQKPIGFLGGVGAVTTIPQSFQVQFGGRFSF
jgi:Carboxypeptidase regulatory-like domain/TonB dependent receptor